jgi:hypothetical protein
MCLGGEQGKRSCRCDGREITWMYRCVKACIQGVRIISWSHIEEEDFDDASMFSGLMQRRIRESS